MRELIPFWEAIGLSFPLPNPLTNGQSFDRVWDSKSVDLNPKEFLGTTHFVSCYLLSLSSCTRQALRLSRKNQGPVLALDLHRTPTPQTKAALRQQQRQASLPAPTHRQAKLPNSSSMGKIQSAHSHAERSSAD